MPQRRGLGRSFGVYLLPPVHAHVPAQLPKRRDPVGEDLLRFLLREVQTFNHSFYGELGLLSVGVGIAQDVAYRVGGLNGRRRSRSSRRLSMLPIFCPLRPVLASPPGFPNAL